MPGVKPIRIPYDSLTMAAVVWELQAFVGGKVQRISQPDEWTIGIGLYGEDAGAGMLLISSHPQFARAYLTTKRLRNQPLPPAFCATLRARLEGAQLLAATQIDFDRILELQIGSHRLIAELMGKHSNMMLVDEDKKLVSAVKWVGRSKSSRPVQPGGKYHPPPFEKRPPLFAATPDDDLKQYTGASPFLVQLIAADPSVFGTMQRCAMEGEVRPVLSAGHGAYPISVASLGLKELPRSSISIALEQHYDAALVASEIESVRGSLIGQLERVVLAREEALQDLRTAEESGNRAGERQLNGELILAYGGTLAEGASILEATDYEGNPLTIKLDPELDFKQNANAYFDKAKRAKASLGVVRDQIARIGLERAEIQSLIVTVKATERLDELRKLADQARSRRWLNRQPPPSAKKEDRPFEGHRVRELLGPGGWTVLFGENAEANDYLMLRVARPNDWWLHVRGNTSAHVVVLTKNQPEKVGREVLEYAARVAVQHSPVKHSGFVPVDYTLKKYVRKQRGAAKGAAFYTHEKTLHIES